jgi:hypothetical protein
MNRMGIRQKRVRPEAAILKRMFLAARCGHIVIMAAGLSGFAHDFPALYHPT